VSAELTIETAPHRSVWIFALDLPTEDIDDFTHETIDADGTSSWPLGQALGLSPFPDQDGVEVFDLDALKDFGFSRYLTQANGLAIDNDASMLDALNGHVVLVFDTALTGAQTTFEPQAPLSFIARYALDFIAPSFEDLESESASPQHIEARPPLPPARISGLVATAVLIFLALFVVLFIWIAA
jgi:hypothetical protein